MSSLSPTGRRAANPVTLAEVKEYLRITDTVQDNVINALIKVASDYAETCTGLTIQPTQFQLKLDYFPYGYTAAVPWSTIASETGNDSPYYSGSSIILPRAPLYSATEEGIDFISVSYTNTSGGTTALENGVDFLVDEDARPGRLYLPYNGSWPQTRGIQGAVMIYFSAGFDPLVASGASRNALPDGIRQGILLYVSHLYEERRIVSDRSVDTVPMSIESLFWAERLVSL